ncbi:MAG: single-stranded DNA-binding protein [Ruminococcus sp.]|nr:single-stranded DNA-binding protein [Ruminococcus sp.]MBR1751888.1 single-stranded DNA-binding protein [Ruminococcus sp.]MBR1752939.1 single-stranded DNA-binding protein [Ruminococcus sp.]
MNSINVMGRVTAEPELRTTKTDKKVLTFRIAVNCGFGEKQTVDFFKISLWNEYAVSMSKILSKGRLIGACGEVHLEEYTDKNGVKGSTMVIKNASITLGDKSKDGISNSESEFEDMTDFEEV